MVLQIRPEFITRLSSRGEPLPIVPVKSAVFSAHLEAFIEWLNRYWPLRKSIDDIDAPAWRNTRAATAPSAEQSDDVEQEPDGDALVLVNPKEDEDAGE